MNPFHKSQTLSGDMVRGSALTPLLWLCLEISLPCFAAAFILKDGVLMYVFLLIGIAPIVQALRSYSHFMHTDPNALRSEKYNIEAKKLEILGSRGAPLETEEPGIKNPDIIDATVDIVADDTTETTV